MIDLNTLIVPLKVDDVEAATLSTLQSMGFPVTSWISGSVARTLVRAWSRGISDLSQTVSNIAKGGYLSYAEGDWLTLLAKSFWNLTRIKAVATQGYVLVTLSSTAIGSTTWNAGEFVVEDISRNAQFFNTSAFTLTPGSSVSVLVQAITPGTIGNVGNGTITRIITGVTAGASVSNPIYSGSTWIATVGRNEETDTELKDRCVAKWGTLGAGGTEAALQYWALSAGAVSVTKATVKRGTDGAIDVYIASPVGAVSSTDLSTVTTVLNSKRPLCSDLTVSSAVSYAFYVGGSVIATSSQLSTAQSNVTANLNALFQGIPMGGTIYINDVISAIMSAPGVISLDMKNISGTTYAQTANVGLSANEAATWTNGLSWSS
jgi:uncharacterized phage protein gp47/JayE